MAQPGFAFGAPGPVAPTGSDIVSFGIRGGRWARTAAVATIVLGLACGLAWFGWHSMEPRAPRAAGQTTSTVVTGDVVVEGGAPRGSDSDIQPIRSASMLVTGHTASGRRLTRRFSADRQGRFSLKLPPGTYTVTAVLYQGSIPLAQEPHATLHVGVGQEPHIRILQHAA